MWELYAMWAWIGLFFHTSVTATRVTQAGSLAGLATFAVIAVGLSAPGSAASSPTASDGQRRRSPRWPTARPCALIMGWLFGGPPALLVLVGIVWGITVIADSAQFSASITELSDPSTVGTMLTIQTSAGFLLTLFSIQLIGPVVAAVGWAGGFSMLAVGPILGCWATARLRAHPAGPQLAGGLR